LAWLLATCPDEKLRNGAQAVALAEKSRRARSIDWRWSRGLLAAAYAEMGRFQDALQTGNGADVGDGRRETNLVMRNAELLELVRRGQAYRQPSPAGVVVRP